MTTPEVLDATILKRLLDQQQEGLFTDLEVRLQDGTDRVSRNLFAALSDVFRSMLAHSMVEGRERLVRFDNVTLDTWRCVFQFYYAKKDVLNESNVSDVLEFSHMYQLDALQEHCCSFLSKRCSAENCLDIWRTANIFHLHHLQSKSLEIITANFIQVAKQENFLELTLEEVLALLDNENLVTTEDELCSALLRWMEKQKTCEGNVLSIFDNIFVDRLSDGMIEQLLNKDQLHQNTSFYCKLVENQMKILESATPRTSSSTVCRRGHPQENTIVVGQAGGQLFICSWSPAKKRWSTLCKTYYPPEFSSVKVEDTVFITGGHSTRTSRALKRTTLFSLKSGTRSQGPVLNHGRYGHCMAVVGNAAFVVGGETDGCYRISIEMCDSKKCDRWETVGKVRTSFGSEHVTGVAALGNKLVIATSVHWMFSSRGIQLFDLTTKTISVLSCQMPPMSLQLCCGVSCGNAACLLDASGSVCLFRKEHENISFEGVIRLNNFVPRINFGLTFDGVHLTVFGGDILGRPNTDLHNSVSRFDLQGQELDNGDLERLPLKMRVHCAFHSRPDKL